MAKRSDKLIKSFVGSAVVICALGVAITWNVQSRPATYQKRKGMENLLFLPSLEYKYTKFLMVVVDGPDVYLGAEKVEKENMGEFLMKFAELNKLRAIEVLGSDSASYKDVVRVIGSIDRNRVPYVTLHTRPCSIGFRGDPIQKVNDW